ncbi:hypothetical protein GF351_01980 [Candidatus Woesearchaeota archaeon]|nr:hypothetical protein [Candidatus Woesearchaeota archaeon]
MKAWLMDAYRKENSVVLWIKTAKDDIRIERPFQTSIFIGPAAENMLKRYDITYRHARKKTYMGREKHVLELPVPKLSSFEKFVRDIEHATRHRINLYDADIKPEQMFLYKHDLRPCSAVQVEGGKIVGSGEEHPVPLKKVRIKVCPSADIHLDKDARIRKIKLDSRYIKGIEDSGEDEEEERILLQEFAKQFQAADPDVIVMDHAFAMLPYLAGRMERHGISCPFHRWDHVQIRYKGGRSFWSYGQVRYRDYAVRLRGRFLVDTNTFVGTECEPEGIAEIAQLSGTLFQNTASRSFGAAFQTALVREMVRRDYLVPYKEKPIDRPLSMLEMVKTDRGGHYHDPKVGFHTDVAEIDFTSMFPWLIYNHNISADCMLAEKGHFVDIPNTPFKTSISKKGLIPTALKPFIERRMHYKRNPSAINKKRALGLKWVLVSCYGYLRFREFKLGIPTSHMAICALARETLLKVIMLAEKKGFEVVHAIVDSLFIRKKGITDDEVKDFCTEVEMLTGIPITSEGIFRWIVFLPSVVDPHRALPSTYYGVFRHKEIKARGIEVRQRSAPMAVKFFQNRIIEMMGECDTEQEIKDRVPEFFRYLRELIRNIKHMKKEYLILPVRITKTEYKHNTPQKTIVERLKQKGVRLNPGELVEYIFQEHGMPVLPEEYNGKPDVDRYSDLLIRALFVILQPFGYRKEDVIGRIREERQRRIDEFQ